MTTVFLQAFHFPDLKKRKRKINLCPKLKTGGIEAFQTAISKGEEKTAALVELSENTMSISKVLVFEDCSKPQTNLKTIIGTVTRDRLHSVCWSFMGVISYSALGHCSSFPKNSISERYELLILLQRSACLPFIPDFVQTHNYIGGDFTGQKSISTQASPPACTSSIKPSSLHQAWEVKERRDLNAYLMSPVTWFT